MRRTANCKSCKHFAVKNERAALGYFIGSRKKWDMGNSI
jgi:hypothetical protein